MQLLERPVPVGCSHTRDGQKYESIELFQHNGKKWLVWLSRCTTCGECFQTITPQPTYGNIRDIYFTRRCKLHARPGKRVTPEEVNGSSYKVVRSTGNGRWVRKEPITMHSTLSEVRRQLAEWKIPNMMKSCAMSRGLTDDDEFDDIYERYVQGHFQKRNRAGELIFGDKDRSKFWGWYWLRDNGYPSLEYRLKVDPNWHDTGKTRTGTRLLLFNNPALSPESPDA